MILAVDQFDAPAKVLPVNGTDRYVSAGAGCAVSSTPATTDTAIVGTNMNARRRFRVNDMRESLFR